MNPKQARVVVAMSGGVDSSLAAALLSEQGYEVIGVTMKLWSYDETGAQPEYESSCCSLEDIQNARLVCTGIGIPHYTLDLSSRFKKMVMEDFVQEYRAGRTPNPCVQCNTRIKWRALLDRGDELDADCIATGQYARISRHPDSGRMLIARGLDPRKDQSYVLWGIDPSHLERTLFPLGELTKAQVREAARRFKLRTADTPESQEICFIPDNDYRRFIAEKYPEVLASRPPGDFVNGLGEVVGTHAGVYNYTIGQRKGLGLALGDRVYVNQIDVETNTIRVGSREDSLATKFEIDRINWFLPQSELPARPISAQIRYNHAAAALTDMQLEGDRGILQFSEAQHAITPGQSAVLYDGDFVVAGGTIHRVLGQE